MRLFRNKSDALAERKRMLDAQLQAVNERIKMLSEQSKGASLNKPQARQLNSRPSSSSNQFSADPVFVEIGRDSSLIQPTQCRESPELYNDLGVRKFDLASSWRKLTSVFRGPEPTNPRLVQYLAAGSIHGLRPLRKEKRIARNRFLILVVCLTFLLWGALVMFMRH